MSLFFGKDMIGSEIRLVAKESIRPEPVKHWDSRFQVEDLTTVYMMKYQRESKFQIWICDALNIEMHHGDWIRSLHPFWAKKLCFLGQKTLFLGQKTLFLGQKALFLGQFLTDKRVLPSYCNLVFNSPVFCTGFYYGILQSYMLYWIIVWYSIVLYIVLY